MYTLVIIVLSVLFTIGWGVIGWDICEKSIEKLDKSRTPLTVFIMLFLGPGCWVALCGDISYYIFVRCSSSLSLISLKLKHILIRQTIVLEEGQVKCPCCKGSGQQINFDSYEKKWKDYPCEKCKGKKLLDWIENARGV